jgi:hypothetical protein
VGGLRRGEGGCDGTGDYSVGKENEG